MTAEYNREAEGLQAVEKYDYPEVVPQHSPLEVVSPNHNFSLKRDAYSPEAFAAGQSSPHSDAWPQSHETKGMMSSAEDANNEKGYNADTAKSRKCGLRRPHFWLLVGLLVVVVLAAVLGGVLGTRESKSYTRASTLSDANNTTADNTTTVGGTSIFAEFHALNKTGLALTSSTPDLVRAYYMDEDNQIIEAEYLNKTWLNSDGEPHTVTNITSRAAKGSPIAAVTYNFNDGAEHRQIFFYDNDGLVATTNATNDGAWSEVYNPFPELTKYPGAEGLAACVGTSSGGLKGMRVYMTNDNGYIQEIGFDFDSSRYPSWNAWMPFNGSDPESGVACNIVGDINHLYFRNKTTSLLHQWTWDYSDINASWNAGPRSTNTPVAQGGSVATTSDGKSTDYLFFQSDGGVVVNGLFTGGSLSGFPEGLSTLNAASADYHLAAVWTDEATMLNQISVNPSQLAFSMVSRDGEARNGTIATT